MIKASLKKEERETEKDCVKEDGGISRKRRYLLTEEVNNSIVVRDRLRK